MSCKRQSLAALRILVQALRSEGAFGPQVSAYENLIFSAGIARPVQPLTCLRDFTASFHAASSASAAAAAARHAKPVDKVDACLLTT
jgi:hypothetical protein